MNTERETGPVAIPREIFIGIDAVRASGLTNILARDVVEGLARRMGFPEAARWIRDNPGMYACAVFHGIRAIDAE